MGDGDDPHSARTAAQRRASRPKNSQERGLAEDTARRWLSQGARPGLWLPAVRRRGLRLVSTGCRASPQPPAPRPCSRSTSGGQEGPVGRWKTTPGAAPARASNLEVRARHTPTWRERLLGGPWLSARPETPLQATVIFSPRNFSEKRPPSLTPSVENYPEAPVTVPPEDRNGAAGANGATHATRTPMSWRGRDGVARPVVPRAPEAWAPAPCGSIRLPTGPQMPRPPGPGLRAEGPRPGRDVAPHVAELPADGGAHSGQGRGRLLARLGERLLSPLVAGEKKHPSDQPRGRAGHRPQSQDTVPKVRLPGHRGRVCAQATGPQGDRGCALRLWPPNPAMTASWPHCDPSSPSATPTSGQRTAKARLGPQEAPLHPPGAKEPPGIHSAPAPPGVPLRHRACSPSCATLSRRPRGPADLHLAPPPQFHGRLGSQRGPPAACPLPRPPAHTRVTPDRAPWDRQGALATRTARAPLGPRGLS